MTYCFKMAVKLPIFISCHFDFGKKLKIQFLKGIFQWNLAYYNGRSWIHLDYWNKNWQILPLWNFRVKTIFCRPPKCWFMLISKKTTGVDLIFFSSIGANPWGWQLKKKYRSKFWRNCSEICDKRLWVPWTPLVTWFKKLFYLFLTFHS